MNQLKRGPWLLIALPVAMAALWLLHPYLLGAGWGAILAITIFPLFHRVEAHHRARYAFLAAAGMLLLLLVFAGVATAEVLRVVAFLIPLWQKESAGHWPVPDFLQNLPLLHGTFVPAWNHAVALFSHPLATWPSKVPYVIGIFRGAGGVTANLLIAVFVFFFLLKDAEDAERILKGVGALSPLLESAIRVSVGTVRAVTWSVFAGVMGEVLCFWLLFSLAGIPFAFVLALFLSLFAIIPIVGTVGMISLGGFLLFQHQWWIAGLVTVIGLVILGFADNFGKPVLARIVSSDQSTPSVFWIITGMLTGVSTMGVIGVFLGPAVFAVMIHLLNYLTEDIPIPEVSVGPPPRLNDVDQPCE